MDVRLITAAGVERAEVDDLPAVLKRGDALVWVDIPPEDEQAVHVLTDVFGFHPLAVRDSLERNPVPKVHVYRKHEGHVYRKHEGEDEDGYVFIVLHAPEQGAGGHVHFVELDQFVGPGYVVTVHGPLNPAVDPDVALNETRAVAKRLESGRLRPSSAAELSFAIVTALTTRLRDYVATLTKDVWKLEQRVMAEHVGDPETFLEELFRARHGLLAVRTMAALSSEVYGRMATLVALGPDAQPLLADIVDQFNRIRTIADGQKEYLQGVIEFYQTRTNTKMTIAAERLAVIAAVTLPVTALSSVLGMNVIVNDRTRPVELVVALAFMAVMSVMLLIWAKRKGWW
jgi:Mg2+ and Co2+ transporter CorA